MNVVTRQYMQNIINKLWFDEKTWNGNSFQVLVLVKKVPFLSVLSLFLLPCLLHYHLYFYFRFLFSFLEDLSTFYFLRISHYFLEHFSLFWFRHYHIRIFWINLFLVSKCADMYIHIILSYFFWFYLSCAIPISNMYAYS